MSGASTSTRPLKGRKAFRSDLETLVQHGLPAKDGWSATDFGDGEDDGAIQFQASHDALGLTITLLASETSEYPKNHVFFVSYTLGEHPSVDDALLANVTAVLEDLPQFEGLTIADAAERVLKRLRASTTDGDVEMGSADEDEDAHTEIMDDPADFDHDFMTMSQSIAEIGSPSVDMAQLKRDFLGTLAASYRPGLLRTTSAHSSLSLSVSLPLSALSHAIPAHALLAWDRRLLTPRAHLVLVISGMHGVYPPLDPRTAAQTEEARKRGAKMRFVVGLVRGGAYKPAAEAVTGALRTFGLKAPAAPTAQAQYGDGVVDASLLLPDEDGFGAPNGKQGEEAEEEGEEDGGKIHKMSLSASLERLLETHLVPILQLRKRFGLGWAGAEQLHDAATTGQRDAGEVYKEIKRELQAADKKEQKQAQTHTLPPDPLSSPGAEAELNFPLAAFAFLLRRLTLCTRYCMVCHRRLTTDYEALKPYVCDAPLCSYHYYSLNLGPSLEYEICTNAPTVDLLVSLAHLAASSGALDEPLPRGLGMRVPPPKGSVRKPPPRTMLGLLGAGAAPGPVAQPPQPQPQAAGTGAGPASAPAPAIAAVATTAAAAAPAATSASASGAGRITPFVAAAAAQFGVTPARAGGAVASSSSSQVPAGEGPDRPVTAASDGLCEFDELSVPQMRKSIVEMIGRLPPIEDMKSHLEQKVIPGVTRPTLRDMDPDIPLAAWTILRWCVASCTADIHVSEPDERIRNVSRKDWMQFRFVVGAPDKEAQFKDEVEKAKKEDKNAAKYPTILGFHGSPIQNWHSIIRNGLWFKYVANGRAFGHGVYFGKDGATSMHYGASGGASTHQWKNSKIMPSTCLTLAEIVNLPHKFVSNNPHYVVGDTSWIMCRHLLVKTYDDDEDDEPESVSKVPLMTFDPQRPTTLNQQAIAVPEPSHKMYRLLEACRKAFEEVPFDDEDQNVFGYSGGAHARPSDGVSASSSAYSGPANGAPEWTHDPDWVSTAVETMLPPPLESTQMAVAPLQRELRAMMAEQTKASAAGGAGLAELGWYMPPEHNGENLFQWVVELHSFDPELPVAQDMAREEVNSLVFEIRFPPDFPHAPPFFRILLPRMLPFIQGGGGHVTGGGSICMDLLTSDGWLPSYTISAILLQIKLAISNLDPRPARLAQNWSMPYSPHEALEGYERAARTHGWKIPTGLNRLVTRGRY
ncbi:hypothetical protein CONPUDRAFT_85969 [Coniophora puteana RWD-64-598 SS2]|uniref:UBC core domain-containing protein n=1 Tax=Coniophora puteana (strain RWD-64-598) TaxID=741705 RepID=R7SET8_CONPW|nr:uncharacterized protein CONPUDRAFT_85969 [Coniophora puteana RWD-64-598 SS2]EIW74242.1 hypothetical protein CONPUDRAFT_85969 [Coniophora puteana RWD-64-598 SS2]